MLAKMWKKVLLAVCIIACIFNIMSKLVNRHSLETNLKSANDGNTVLDAIKKENITQETLEQNNIVEQEEIINNNEEEKNLLENEENSIISEEDNVESNNENKQTFKYSDFTVIF